jgi:hypothetical protein
MERTTIRIRAQWTLRLAESGQTFVSGPLSNAIRPAAICVGAQNRYGHLTAETLAALGRVPT